MGHHNKITVESANNAYTPPSSPTVTATITAVATTATTVTTAVTTTGGGGSTTGAAAAVGRDNACGSGGNCIGRATATAMQNNDTERLSSDYYFYHAYDNASSAEAAVFFPLNGTAAGIPDASFEKPSCQWIPVQQTLFQFSNICFLAAFIVPRSYKLSVLSLRALLCLGFLLSGLWASTEVCAVDALLWYGSLALINGVHALKLCKKFMPPALSVELMELYTRVFKPLKVSQKHFRELTREAAVVELSPGQCYAVQEVTACDQRLSILLKGRCSVTCEGTQLHNINSFQFIDSPEWMASTLMHGESVFQVTITAAEDCMYLCWQISKLNRILKHRTQLHAVLASIIGKDITHKMYSLNEQLGQAKSFDDQSRAARNDHWRQAIYRSVSFDAVNTGTKGTVRSDNWKRYRDRKASLFADVVDSPSFCSGSVGGRKCWIPVVTTQMSNSSAYTSMTDGHSSSADEEREPMLPAARPDDIPLYRLDGQQSAVALIPVIVPVPVQQAAGAGLQPVAQRPSSLRRHNSNTSNRGVKFSETVF